MAKPRYGRSQKHLRRKRCLYALLFENGCAYIGQSVDPRERERQHRKPAGGWCGKAFIFVPLGVMEGTELQATDYEYAWRHKAGMHGWTIYGKPPDVVVKHGRRMTLRRHFIACSVRWPRKHSRNRGATHDEGAGRGQRARLARPPGSLMIALSSPGCGTANQISPTRIVRWHAQHHRFAEPMMRAPGLRALSME